MTSQIRYIHQPSLHTAVNKDLRKMGTRNKVKLEKKYQTENEMEGKKQIIQCTEALNYRSMALISRKQSDRYLSVGGARNG